MNQSDVEREARELLAAEWEGLPPDHFKDANEHDEIPTLFALRAITAALRKQQQEAEDEAHCAECGVKLELVRPGKYQHPDCSQSRIDHSQFRELANKWKCEWSAELGRVNRDRHYTPDEFARGLDSAADRLLALIDAQEKGA